MKEGYWWLNGVFEKDQRWKQERKNQKREDKRRTGSGGNGDRED